MPNTSQSNAPYPDSYSPNLSPSIPPNNYLTLGTTTNSASHRDSSSSLSLPVVEGLGNGDLRCPYCKYRPSGKPSRHLTYYRKHLVTHDKPSYVCELCDKAYTRPDNLDVHIRKHHPAKRRRVNIGSVQDDTSTDST